MKFRKADSLADPNANLVEAFDPWHGMPPPRRSDPDDAESAPAAWHRLSPAAAVRVGWVLTEGTVHRRRHGAEPHAADVRPLSGAGE